MLLVTQRKNWTVLHFPEWRGGIVLHFPEENLFPMEPCTRTHLTRIEMGLVLLFCRDWNFGSLDYLLCVNSPIPMGERKPGNWHLIQRWVAVTFRVPARAAEDGHGAKGVLVRMSLVYCLGSWKGRAGRAAPSDCSVAVSTAGLGGSRAEAQRLSLPLETPTQHGQAHNSQEKVTLSICRWTCQLHLGFHYQLVISSKRSSWGRWESSVSKGTTQPFLHGIIQASCCDQINDLSLFIVRELIPVCLENAMSACPKHARATRHLTQSNPGVMARGRRCYLLLPV